MFGIGIGIDCGSNDALHPFWGLFLGLQPSCSAARPRPQEKCIQRIILTTVANTQREGSHQIKSNRIFLEDTAPLADLPVKFYLLMRVKPGAGHSPLHCLPDIWCTYDDVLHLSKWGPNFEWNGTWWAFNMYAASFDEQTLKYFDEDWGPKSPLAKAPVQYSLNKMDSFLIGIMDSSSKFFLFGQILPHWCNSSSLVQVFLMGKTLPHGYNSSSLARLSPVDFFLLWCEHLVVMHVQSVLLCLRSLHRTLYISDVLSPLIDLA